MKFRSIVAAVGRWLGGGLFGRVPKPPSVKERQNIHGEVMAFHRGLALKSRKAPNLSAENIAKWRELTVQDAQDFIDGYPFFAHSSNVAMVQYFYQVKQMMVEYKNRRAYLYKSISVDEALIFFGAFSKGGWVWDNLRIRGTATGFKKYYIRLK